MRDFGSEAAHYVAPWGGSEEPLEIYLPWKASEGMKWSVSVSFHIQKRNQNLEPS